MNVGVSPDLRTLCAADKLLIVNLIKVGFAKVRDVDASPGHFFASTTIVETAFVQLKSLTTHVVKRGCQKHPKNFENADCVSSLIATVPCWPTGYE